MNAFLIEFKDTLNVLLGWTLGLATALGVAWWTKRNEARNVRTAISRELREVAHRLIALIFILESGRGALNRQLLEWMESQIRRYEGPNPKDRMLAGIAGLLKASDSEMQSLAALELARSGPEAWPSEGPGYTTGAVAKLQDLHPDYAVRVLDVLAHMRMLSEDRERSEYYLRLTFTPGLSVGNYDRAERNRQSAQAEAAKRARIIVDKITALEERYPQDP